MTPDSLPSSASEDFATYDPQLDAEDAALSSGNTRLGILVGALFGLGVLTYALVPSANGSSAGLAAVTPSFMLEGASVTASREVTPAPAAATATEDNDAAAPTKAKTAEASQPAAAAPRPSAPKPAATASAATAALSPILPEPVTATVAAPAPVAEAVRAAPTTVVLSGRILDEVGKPLVGATVLLKGSGKGTSTDANGHYELEAPAGDNSLLFGYGGYQDEEMRIRSAQPQSVTLTPTPGAKRRRK